MPGSRRIGAPTTNTGISIEPSLLARAKKQAKRNRQSFSAYVQSLLVADLGLSSNYTSAELEKRIAVLEERLGYERKLPAQK